MVEDVGTDVKEARKRAPYEFEVGDKALIYRSSSKVNSRDPRRRDLFHVSVSEIAIHF